MSKTVDVTFTDVGRDKKSWTAPIGVTRDGYLSESSLLLSIRKHKALMSRDVECTDDGGIYVGGFRRVGSFAVAKATEAP